MAQLNLVQQAATLSVSGPQKINLCVTSTSEAHNSQTVILYLILIQCLFITPTLL